MTTWVPTGIVTASSADLAVHSWPSMTAAPDGSLLSIFLITFAFLPISPSTFVFTVSRLTNRIASGLVKRRRTNDTIRNTTSCVCTENSSTAAKNANTAPPANQIVVSAMVAASIPIRITKATNHPIISIKSLLYARRCLAVSNIRIDAAMAAFNDSTFPAMGIFTQVSAMLESFSVSPFPSFPIRNAVLPV